MKTMKKTITLLVMLALFLTGCSSTAATEEAVVVPTEEPSANQAEEQSAEPEAAPEVSRSEGSDIVLEQAQFVYGVFQMEESELAVTTEQANTLLPLLTSLQELTSFNMGGRPDENTTEQIVPDESAMQQQEQLKTLMTQISEVLTTEQLESINSMEITQEIMQIIMEKYGVEITMGGEGRQGEGGPAGNGGQPSQGDAQQGTPPEGDAAQSGQGMNLGGRGGSMSVSPALLEALIQLLQERAGI